MYKEYSQIGQDKFVLKYCGDGGTFVEIGASYPKILSNSARLENHGWKGLCVDPLIDRQKYEEANRTCIIDQRAVYKYNGEVSFVETPDSELSGIKEHTDTDGDNRTVPCATLTTLLQEHNMPSVMDYLSLDTEGSELEIINSHDWNAHSFDIVTVEHNCDEGKAGKLIETMRAKGYDRFIPVEFDLWFIHERKIIPENTTVVWAVYCQGWLTTLLGVEVLVNQPTADDLLAFAKDRNAIGGHNGPGWSGSWMDFLILQKTVTKIR